MSAIEPRPGEVYRTYGGRDLYVEGVNARTVIYRDGEQPSDTIPLEAPRWLFESVIEKPVRVRE